jgi:hypothetical protein
MSVRTLTSAHRNHRLAIVTLPGESEVRVRFRRSNKPIPQWRCDSCGAHRFSTCPHEIAARQAWQKETTR